MSFFRIRDVPAPVRGEIDSVAEATGSSRRVVVEALLGNDGDDAREALLEGFLVSFLMSGVARDGQPSNGLESVLHGEASIGRLASRAAEIARAIVAISDSKFFDERADIPVAELDDEIVAGIRSLAEEFGLPPPIAARFLIQARAGSVSERVRRSMFPDQEKDTTP